MRAVFGLGLALSLLAACGETRAGDDALYVQATSPAAQLAAACSGCHGEAGTAIVSLEGYRADSLRERLTAYRSDAGTSVMHRIAGGYSDAEIDLISSYLAAGEPPV